MSAGKSCVSRMLKTLNFLIPKLQSLVYRITVYNSQSRSFTEARITVVDAAEDLTREDMDQRDKLRILPSGIRTNDLPMRINSLDGANCFAT